MPKAIVLAGVLSLFVLISCFPGPELDPIDDIEELVKITSPGTPEAVAAMT